MPGAVVQCCVTNAALSLSLPPLVTKVAALPKGIVWKVLNDATDLVKLDLVTIDDHFNYAVMQMLIACLAHHLFLSWQFILASTEKL